MNRSRANLLLKVEKENENKDIKIKQKLVQHRASINPTKNAEKAGQNASKQSGRQYGGTTKSSQSNDRSNPNEINCGESIVSPYMKTSGTYSTLKRVSPYMAPTAGPKPRLGQRYLKRSKEQNHPSSSSNGEIQDENVQVLNGKPNATTKLSAPYSNSQCDTMDLHGLSSRSKSPCKPKSFRSSISQAGNLSARTLKGSHNEHLDYISTKSRPDIISTCSGSSTYLNLDLDFCSLGSPSCKSEVFYDAPSLPVPKSKASLDSSASLERKFRYALDVKQTFMEDEEIKIVKNVLKNDQRHSLLKHKNVDPNIFSSILKSQLDNIVYNEMVIKTALVKLGAVDEVEPKIAEILPPKHKILCEHNFKQNAKKNRKPNTVCYSSDDNSPERSYDKIYSNSYRNEEKEKEKKEKDKKETGRKKARSVEVQREYEKFLQNTLPLKRRSANKKESSSLRDVDSESDVQVHMDLKDLVESEEQLSEMKSSIKPQVNVTFKNIKSTEKEILILRALGDRLEATLKRTSSEPSLSDLEKKEDVYASGSMTSLTKELRKVDSSIRIYPGRGYVPKRPTFLVRSDILLWEQKGIENLTFSMGLVHEIGIVKEFIIANRTIDELRSDSKTSFYIPKSGQLLRISFEHLRNEPELFLQLIKPKSADQPFNFLDHDPIFFNSIIKPPFQVASNEKTLPTMPSSSFTSKENVTVCEGGDSLVVAAEGIKKSRTILKSTTKLHSKSQISSTSKKRYEQVNKIKEIKQTKTENKEQFFDATDNIKKIMRSVSSPIKSRPSLEPIPKRHSRIRKTITPMPFESLVEPKSRLLKKCLIGVIQLAIFLGVIIALSLPDITC